jgi:diazepam-binding inhibitor (GABA receptor modulating acyl-CoA-binding protein)
MSDFSAFGLSEDEEFEEASNFVRGGTFDISTEDQLKFYAFFKQATVGPCNTPKPGFFSSFADSSKWYSVRLTLTPVRNAWKSLEGMNHSEAKLQYVALLDSLQPEWKYGKTTGKKPSWTVFSTMGGQDEQAGCVCKV